MNTKKKMDRFRCSCEVNISSGSHFTVLFMYSDTKVVRDFSATVSELALGVF